MKQNMFKRILSLAMAGTMVLSLFPTVVTEASAAAGTDDKIFVEYFDDYSRKSTESGISEGTPVTWSDYESTINESWATGVAPETSYNGSNLMGDDNFAVRYTTIYNTGSYTGDYYFQVFANDGKYFEIYDEATDELVASYQRWYGSNGVSNTSSTNGLASAEDAVGCTLIGTTDADISKDVIKVSLEGDSQYRIVYDFAEGSNSAVVKLHCATGEQVTDDTAVATVPTTAYLIPASAFSLPEEYAQMNQGYIYDSEGNGLASATVTIGDETATTNENGYYCFLGLTQEGDATVTLDGYQAATATLSLDESAVEAVTLMAEGEEPTEPEVEVEPQITNDNRILAEYYYEHTANTTEVTRSIATYVELRDTPIDGSTTLPYDIASSAVIGTSRHSVAYFAYLYVEEAGTYTFEVEAGSSHKLEIDDVEIINELQSSVYTGDNATTATLYLEAGYHDFELVCVSKSTSVGVYTTLSWSKDGGDLEVIPMTNFFIPDGYSVEECVEVTGIATDSRDDGALRYVLTFTNDETGFVYEARCGFDGTYQTLLPMGEYTVTGEGDTFVDSPATAFSVTGEGLTYNVYDLADNTTGQLFIRVLNTDVDYTVVDENGVEITGSLLDGIQDEERLEEGWYDVTITAEGYVPVTRTVLLERNKNTNIYEKMEEISAVVTGTAAADATVLAVQGGEIVQQVVADSKGAYTMHLLAGSYTFYAVASGNDGAVSTTLVGGNNTVDFSMDIANATDTITVTRTDGMKEAIEGALVVGNGSVALTDAAGVAAVSGDYMVYALGFDSAKTDALQPVATQWHVYDVNVSVDVDDPNPYMHTTGKLYANFTHTETGEMIKMYGFYRDNNVWTLRFEPTKAGEWTYEVGYDTEYTLYYDLNTLTDDVDESDPYDADYFKAFTGLTGSVMAVANENEEVHGAIMQDPENVQHFLYADGTDAFLMGYEVDWAGLMDLGTEGIDRAKQVIDTLADAGFNDVLMNMVGWDTSWCKGYSTIREEYEDYDFGPPDSLPWVYDGELSLDNYVQDEVDYTQMNEEYWANFDEVLAYMNSRGVTAHIYWKVFNKSVLWENFANEDTFLLATDTMYNRYFSSRFAAYNVIFDLGKESGNYDKDNAQSTVPPELELEEGEGTWYYQDAMLLEFANSNTTGRITTIHDFDAYYKYLVARDNSGGSDKYGDNISDVVQLYSDQQHNTNLYGMAMLKKAATVDIPYYNCEANYHWANIGDTNTYDPHAFGVTTAMRSPEGALFSFCEMAMAGAYSAVYYTNHSWDIVTYDEVPYHMDYYMNLESYLLDTVGLDLFKVMTPDDSVLGITSYAGTADPTTGKYSLTSSYDTSDYTGEHALYREGSNYLIYLGYASDELDVSMPERLQEVTLTVTNLEAPMYGEWFNVQTSERIAIEEPITEDGTYTFYFPGFGGTEEFVDKNDGNGPYGSEIAKDASGESVFLYFAVAEEGDIVEVETHSAIEVAYGTSLGAMAPQLPISTNAVLENGGMTSANIQWDTTDYVASPEDSAVDHTYTMVGTLVDLSDDVTNSQNLTAIVEVTVLAYVPEYTVTFDLNGADGMVADQTVFANEPVEAPKTPEYEGYIFEGWMADGELFDLSTPVTGDMNLTAQWRAENYAIVDVVVMNADGTPAEGATVVMDGQTVDVDATGVVSFPAYVEGTTLTATIFMTDCQTITRTITIGAENTTETITTYMVPAQEASTGETEQGLLLKVYEGYTSLDIPETLVPDYTGIKTGSLDNWLGKNSIAGLIDGLPDIGYDYALNYTGQLKVEETDTYCLYVISSYAFRLEIDGVSVLTQTADGWYSDSAYKKVQVELTEGYHALEVTLFNTTDKANGGFILIWEQGDTYMSSAPDYDTAAIPAEYLLQPVVSNVISYVEPIAQQVELDTAVDGLNLSTSMEVYLSDGTTAYADVTWDTASYDGAVAGTYVLTGAIADIAGTAENTGDLTATATITVGGATASTTPAATVSIVADSVDFESGTSTFLLMVENVNNLKTLFFTLEDMENVTVVAENGFDVMDFGDGTYMLAYAQGTDGHLTSATSMVAATITVKNDEGAQVVITDVLVATNDAKEEAVIPEEQDSASTEEIYALAEAKADLIASIEAAFAGYQVDDYQTEQWTELSALFQDAKDAVEAMETQAQVEGYDVNELIAEANAIPTILDIYDLNQDGVINYSDITCISAYYGYKLSEMPELSVYDVTGDGLINSGDYLAVYNYIG